MHSSTIQKLALLAFTVLTVGYSFYVIQPPAPKPKNTALTAFSAERAFKHVRRIATRPHPLGSTANDSVRRYIIKQLQRMGLQPTIQKGVGTNIRNKHGVAGYPKNIFAKIKGRNPEKTLFLMAHYDSVPTGPGAADDAAGVAAILEVIRAIKSQEKPLKNNLWILFTDGEERGLLGAELFVEEFDNLNKIDLVLNFEARGSSGPSMMFETTIPNGNLIPHFAKATPHPASNSLLFPLYKILPFHTDLSVTKRAGLEGLNFAFAEGLANYHTMQDNPENLSLASLQHHGSNLLHNVRHFGSINFNLDSKSKYVYFNNARGGLIYYPSRWSFPLALLPALLFLVYVIFLVRTNQLDLHSYLGSLGLFLGFIIGGTALSYLIWQFIEWIYPQYQWLIFGQIYKHGWYLWGFIFLNFGIFCGIYGWFQQKLSTQQLLSGSFTVWVALTLLSAWYLPVTAYLFNWPLLMGLIGWIVLGDNIVRPTWYASFILALGMTGALFLLPRYIFLLHILLTTQIIVVSVLLFVLMLGLCWPLIWRMIRPRSVMWSATLFLAAVTCVVTALATSGYDAEHKKQNDINYLQNLNVNQAYWVSRDYKPDSWTRQFLGTNYQLDTLPEFTLLQTKAVSDLEKAILSQIPAFRSNTAMYSAAQSIEMPYPSFEVLSDSSSASHRYLTLHIHPRQNGIALLVNWDKELSIAKFSIEGKKLYSRFRPVKYQPSSLKSISYFQDLSKPITIEIAYKRNKSKKATLYFDFVKQGLPTHLISNYEKRAPYMMPAPYSITNSTIRHYAVSLDTMAIGK